MAGGGTFHPGLEGVVALETDISFLDLNAKEIIVRGYDLVALANAKSYTEVAYFILFGHLPSPEELAAFRQELRSEASIPTEVLRLLAYLPRTAHPMDVLRTGISSLGPFDPDLDASSEEAGRRVAIRILAKVPILVANLGRVLRGDPPVVSEAGDFTQSFLATITGTSPSPDAVCAFDRLLILYSEHELPSSTFAARVISSTLADAYGALTGAVASLKGPLHGGANEAVMAMLERVTDPDVFERWLMDALARKERIMGFGHQVYRDRIDPRALLMKETLASFQTDTARCLLALCERGEAVMAREKRLYPNLDYYAAPVLRVLGVPTPLATPIIFAARTVGLLAHVLEQHANNRLFRPRVRYVGPRSLKV